MKKIVLIILAAILCSFWAGGVLFGGLEISGNNSSRFAFNSLFVKYLQIYRGGAFHRVADIDSTDARYLQLTGGNLLGTVLGTNAYFSGEVGGTHVSSSYGGALTPGDASFGNVRVSAQNADRRLGVMMLRNGVEGWFMGTDATDANWNLTIDGFIPVAVNRTTKAATFLASPIVPNGTTSTAAINKSQLDAAVFGLGTGTVTNVSSGNSDISVSNQTTTPIIFLNNVNGITKSYYDPTSSIQTQLNGKLATAGTAANSTQWNGYTLDASTTYGTGFDYIYARATGTNQARLITTAGLQAYLGLGSNAYSSTAYAPLASPIFTVNATAPVFNPTATQSTVAGSVSGNIVASQPFQGSSYKKVIIYCNSLNGTATYTFPTTFSFSPMSIDRLNTTGNTISWNETSIMITCTSATSGFITLEGY